MGVYTDFWGGKFLSVWIHFSTILGDTYFQLTFPEEKEWVSIHMYFFIQMRSTNSVWESARLFIFNWESTDHSRHCDFATGCLPRSCAIPRSGQIFNLFSESSIPILESIQLPALWCRGSSHGEKMLVNETDDSPPSSSRLKNAWSYTSVPPYAFLTFTDLSSLSPFLLLKGS